jgi:hypothetical protein
MSIKLMTQVWQRLNCSGGELLLALALADIADDDGDRIYPSVSTLALKTRQSDRQVQRQLKKFRSLTWLQVKKSMKGGRSKTTRYRINPVWINGDNLSPFPDRPMPERVTFETERVTSETLKGDIAMSPDPSLSIREPKSARKTQSVSRSQKENPETEKLRRKIRDYLRDLSKTDYGRNPNVIATLVGCSVEEVQRELETLQ